MSAYSKVKTKFKDQGCLVAALYDLYYAPVVSDTPQPLVDYVGKTRPERAEIVIPRRQLLSASNDVGFAKQPDGTYAAIISQFDSMRAFTAEKLEQLKFHYNCRLAAKTAEQHGMRLVGTKKDPVKGKPHLRYIFEAK